MHECTVCTQAQIKPMLKSVLLIGEQLLKINTRNNRPSALTSGGSASQTGSKTEPCQLVYTENRCGHTYFSLILIAHFIRQGQFPLFLSLLKHPTQRPKPTMNCVQSLRGLWPWFSLFKYAVASSIVQQPLKTHKWATPTAPVVVNSLLVLISLLDVLKWTQINITISFIL